MHLVSFRSWDERHLWAAFREAWLRVFRAFTCACGTVQASIIHACPYDGQDRHRAGKGHLRQTTGHCRAGLCQPLCAQTHAPLHFALETQVDVQWTRTRFALVHNIGKIHVFEALP